MDVLGSAYIREAFKNYLAAFVRREGGGYLPIVAQNIVRKGVEGGTRPTVEMKKTSISISSHIRICPGYSVFLP